MFGPEPTLLLAYLLRRGGPERVAPENGAYNDKPCPIQLIMMCTEELEFSILDLLGLLPLYIVHF